jgi:hypothetical protein
MDISSPRAKAGNSITRYSLRNRRRTGVSDLVNWSPCGYWDNAVSIMVILHAKPALGAVPNSKKSGAPGKVIKLQSFVDGTCNKARFLL